jgi:hypothetical protein
MDKKFVRVVANVDCEWEGWNPVYRVYVNDELFAERTWRWTDCYLEENLQINAEPGEYQLRWELVPPHLAKLSVTDLRIEYGPGLIQDQKLRILDES